MRRNFKLLLIPFLILISCNGINRFINSPAPQESEGSSVDIVFCLDLSGSTNELIEGFRKQFYEIALNLSRYKPTPNIRFGLIGTGRAYYRKENSYVSILCPLTDDPDKFATSLYNIEGSIKVGKPNNVNAAILQGIYQLQWSRGTNSMRLLYVIGNGRLVSGVYTAYSAAQEAVKNGITVNSIFCVNEKNMKEMPEWKLLAESGEGHFYTLNPRVKIPFYDVSPEFIGMRVLNQRLNKTYLPYAMAYAENKKQLNHLDSVAEQINVSVLQTRLILKTTDLYQGKAYRWDLTDYFNKYQNQSVGAEEYINRTIRKKMPDSLRNMGQEAFRNLLERNSEERLKVISMMRRLSPKLEYYTDQDKRKLNLNEGISIRDLMNKSLDAYMESAGFEKEKGH